MNYLFLKVYFSLFIINETIKVVIQKREKGGRVNCGLKVSRSL